MGMKTFEKMILNEARNVTGKFELKMKDIMEWSTGDIKPQLGESLHRLPNVGVNICIKC